MKNSLRLSVLSVGLVGINVYVSFNHKTAPREVLNLQATTKTMGTNHREVLAADARTAREALTAEAAAQPTTNAGTSWKRDSRPKTSSAPVALRAAPAVMEPAAEPATPPVAEAAIEVPLPPPRPPR